MKPFLVIARIGDKSLHQNWLQGEAPMFDCFLSYFGDTENKYSEDATYYEQAKGGKWPELARIINDNWPVISQYQAVWLPDDDLLIDAGSINKLFCFMKTFDLELAQPALSEDSYYSHAHLIRQQGVMLRFTNFVEVMAPVFSRSGLALLRNTFAQSPSGWGLDNLWPHLIKGENKVAVIDDVVMVHTRPIGGELYKKNPELSPENDVRRIEQQYNELELNRRSFKNKFRVYAQLRYLRRGIDLISFFRGKYQRVNSKAQALQAKKYGA